MLLMPSCLHRAEADLAAARLRSLKVSERQQEKIAISILIGRSCDQTPIGVRQGSVCFASPCDRVDAPGGMSSVRLSTHFSGKDSDHDKLGRGNFRDEAGIVVAGRGDDRC